MASTGGAMSEPLCRLSVQAEGGQHSTVDLALPRTTHVGLLMPVIVDFVHLGAGPPVDVRRWRLSRVGGHALDEWTTLDDNDIRDGELLLLTTVDAPEPEWVVDDPCRVVAGIADGGNAPAMRLTATAACLCVAVISATALAWSGVTTHATSHLIAGVVIAVAAAAGAIVVRRAYPDPLPCVALSVVAVVFAAASGFLAVPAGPSAANFLLAAVAGFPMSILLLRLSCCGTTSLTALAAFSALVSAALAIGVVWSLPAAAIGAVLVTVSLAMLCTAARLTIAASSLAPSIDDGAEHVVSAARAASAHRTLTGMIIGSSTAASLGCVLAAADGWPRGVLFTAVVGLMLLLRVRTYVDTTRRIATIAGGLISLAGSFAAAIASAPGQANWIVAIAMGLGAGALAWVFGGVTTSPGLRRGVDVTEYLALAALVPLVCWVIDLYGLIRGASLT
ncbi:type VII secretion integral membrane protein EccD [Mycobacterium sp. MMS18-G62]